MDFTAFIALLLVGSRLEAIGRTGAKGVNMLADCVAVIMIHGAFGAPFGAGRLLGYERSASQPAAH
eukprot:10757233-Alexandrium_andersonii.AAC.1